MKKLCLAVLMAVVFWSGCLWSPPLSQCCVGKKIIIGTLAEPEQKVLANLLALMIRERTGTTVEIQEFMTMEELAGALKKEKIQVYNEYLVAGVNLLKLSEDANLEVTVKTLKREFNRKFNLVWLKPYGFIKSRHTSDSLLSAAPLIDKNTLKLFPALPRLLNKLGGRVDDAKLVNLINAVEEKHLRPEDVAREFLRREKLI